jgi:hypothetical protein
VFHPLLTPLTTYTYTTGSLDTDTVSATDDERLPPGGFSLRHGFPQWFGRAQRSAASSRDVSETMVNSPDPNSTSAHPTFGTVPGATVDVSTVTILDYIRSTFSEESVLDSLPLEAAANPGAYHAWRTYRAPVLQTQQPQAPRPYLSSTEQAGEAAALNRNRRPGEWNWEGVWEDRVKKAIKASLSEPVLFGADDTVRLLGAHYGLTVTDIDRSAFETATRRLWRG